MLIIYHNREQECDVTLPWQRNLGSQQPFLTEAAICIVERWKKSIGYRFVPECNHAQESQTCHFLLLLLPYLQDHGLLRSRNVATMATFRYRLRLLLSIFVRGLKNVILK